MEDFLAALLGSSARAKVMRAFVFERNAMSVHQTAKRSGVSSKTAEDEIRALEKLDIIKRAKFSITIGGTKRLIAGRQKEPAWAMSPTFKHATALSKFVHEVSPIAHKVILSGLRKVGRVSAVILSGSFVGDETRPADLIVAGDGLNESRLEAAIRSLEPVVGRELRYAAFSTPELRYRLTIQDRLLRETLDFPHIVLLDKVRLL